MEVELHSSEAGVASELRFNEGRVEELDVLPSFIDGGLGSVAVPSDLNVVLLVCIHLLEVVSVVGHLLFPGPRQVNGGLVRGHSALVVFNVEAGPVSTVGFEVVRSGLGRDNGGCKECGKFYFQIEKYNKRKDIT